MMRLTFAICTLGLLLGVVSLLMMRGSLTPQTEMETCYEYETSAFAACLERNEQRSVENMDRINAHYRRGVWLFRVSVVLMLVGVVLWTAKRAH